MNKFIKPELQLIEFTNDDIITTSLTSGQMGNECEPFDILNPSCY